MRVAKTGKQTVNPSENKVEQSKELQRDKQMFGRACMRGRCGQALDSSESSLGFSASAPQPGQRPAKSARSGRRRRVGDEKECPAKEEPEAPISVSGHIFSVRPWRERARHSSEAASGGLIRLVTETLRSQSVPGIRSRVGHRTRCVAFFACIPPPRSTHSIYTVVTVGGYYLPSRSGQEGQLLHRPGGMLRLAALREKDGQKRRKMTADMKHPLVGRRPGAS